MKCKDCKYFERSREGGHTSKNEVLWVGSFYNFGGCHSLKIIDYLDLPAKDDCVLDGLAAGSYEEVGFTIGENFGCIHFEEGKFIDPSPMELCSKETLKLYTSNSALAKFRKSTIEEFIERAKNEEKEVKEEWITELNALS